MTRRTLLQSLAAPLAVTAAPARSPNVVLIFCDDLGYGDLGCYGSSIPTPNLDRLASSGIRFTNAISANPVCSPSRAGLLTGRYPTHVGVPIVLFPKDDVGLDLAQPTIADLLKSRNYRTACIGKWHLGHKGAYLPTRRGFDSYFGIPYSNDMVPPIVMENEDVVEPEARQDTLTRRYTERAVSFIRSSSANPFFLYFPHTFPHIPLHASPEFRGRSKQGLYGDVIQEIDWSVGQVLDAIKQRNLTRDTLVLFTSDNGPWYQGSSGRLRGRKGSTLEGGTRVPFIASQPGLLRPAVSSQLVSLLDVTPTIAAHCGAALTTPVDGLNLLPWLTQKQSAPQRSPLLYFDGWNLQCIRDGDWKLHMARHNNMAYNPAPQGGRVNLPLKSPELYNLALDPDESYDVAPENPERVTALFAAAEHAIAAFPKQVQDAWAATRSRTPAPTPAGALPRPGITP